MVKKVGLLVAAITLAAFAAAPSDSFAAAKKQSSSFTDTGQCVGGGCTAVNPDRVPSPQHQYRSSKKKKKSSSSS